MNLSIIFITYFYKINSKNYVLLISIIEYYYNNYKILIIIEITINLEIINLQIQFSPKVLNNLILEYSIFSLKLFE